MISKRVVGKERAEERTKYEQALIKPITTCANFKGTIKQKNNKVDLFRNSAQKAVSSGPSTGI